MVAKKSKEAPEKKEPALDPILPLPHGTGIPYLREGEGKDILDTEGAHRVIELPYRAFWVLWEQAEALAKKNYPKYVGGPMDNVAQAALEATQACRQAFWRDKNVEAVSETEAVRVREMERKKSKQKGVTTTSVKGQEECAHKGFVKKIKTKSGEKLWKCEKCGLKWPRKTKENPKESSPKKKAKKGQRKSASSK